MPSPIPFSAFRVLVGTTGLLGLLTKSAGAQPTVSSLAPARNAPAPRTTTVRVGFSQPVDARSTRALRVFSAQAGGKKAGSATLNGNQLVFAPTTGFKAGETVWATLDTAARSASGRVPLAQAQVWQFTVAAAGTGTFSGGSKLTMPGGDVQLTGDVDGDGSIDVLAVATVPAYAGLPSSGALSLALNDGTGTYHLLPAQALSQPPKAAQLGDVDGDGDVDLVTLDYLAPTGSYSVYHNDGHGTFSRAGGASIGSLPGTQLCLADMDGDSDLDLVYTVATGTGSAAVVRYNSGAGSFPTAVSNAQAWSASNPAVGDVDNDGDLDLLATNYSGNAVATWLNSGAARFVAGPAVAVAGSPTAISLADADGDGDLDLFSSNFSFTAPSVSLRLNNGAGAFGGGLEVAQAAAPTIALGDIDGDNDVDLLITTGQRADAQLLLNTGAGTFGAAPSLALGGNGPHVQLADIDDDGDVDVVASLAGAAWFRLNGGNPVAPYTIAATLPLPNRAAARTAPIVVTFSTPMSSAPASTAGLTAYGSASGPIAGPVVAAGNTLTLTPTRPFRPGEQVSVTVSKAVRSAAGARLAQPRVWQFTAATASGPGTFGPATNYAFGYGYSEPYPYWLELADIDGDQDLDLVSAFSQPGIAGESLTVRRNNGAGVFGPPTPLLAPGKSSNIFHLADLDRDGDLDFVGLMPPGPNVWLNNGAGVFTPNGNLNAIGALADMDGDGDLDSARGDVAFNDGQGNFLGSITALTSGLGYSGYAAADFDGDGQLDCLVSSDNLNATNWYQNEGNGYCSAAKFVVSGSRDVLTVQDLDNDGDVDLVSPGDARILFNDGSGTFTAGPQFGSAGAVAYNPLVTADMDGDGDQDLMFMGLPNRPPELYLNDGHGVFHLGAALLGSPEGEIVRAVAGDLDGDGDLDLVGAYDRTVGTGTTGWSIWLNNSVVTAATAAVPAPQFEVWPQPAAPGTALQVGLTAPAAHATLRLQTVLGQCVQTQVFKGPGTSVPTAGLAPGVYLLSVETPEQPTRTQRVVIQ